MIICRIVCSAACTRIHLKVRTKNQVSKIRFASGYITHYSVVMVSYFKLLGSAKTIIKLIEIECILNLTFEKQAISTKYPFSGGHFVYYWDNFIYLN